MANLYYVIGGSGAGKDSLIGYAQKRTPENTAFEFVRRYITRPADAGGENHIALTETEFLHYKDEGRFAMDWFSHDTYYGIGAEINSWLTKGINVVMNGSRAYLDKAAGKYPEIIPVLINVDPLILRERLFARGRENYNEIQKRIAQSIRLESSVKHTRLSIVENNSSLEEAGEKLLNIIVGRSDNKCA